MLTAALNVWTALTGIRAEPGVIDMAIAGTWMEAEADTAMLVTDVAVMVTLRSLEGIFAGALYVADVLVISLSVPAPDAGDIAQVTPICPGSY